MDQHQDHCEEEESVTGIDRHGIAGGEAACPDEPADDDEAEARYGIRKPMDRGSLAVKTTITANKTTASPNMMSR